MTEKKLMMTMNRSEKTERVTAPSELLPPKLTVPPLHHQHSDPTISRLIAESMSKPQSPMTPSPAGSAQVRSILQRLELIEVESRDLLTKLFSLVQTDAQLERYIRRRLEDPKVSAMWELVEQVLDSQHGRLDIERMLSDQETSLGSGSGSGSGSLMDKGVRVSDDYGGDDGMRNERFKVRRFDVDDDEVVLAHPLGQVGEISQPPTSGGFTPSTNTAA